MTDDLSKWRIGCWVTVANADNSNDEATHRVWVNGNSADKGAVTIGLWDQPPENEWTIAIQSLSLDDAENFATLILYEVKRAKGEL